MAIKGLCPIRKYTKSVYLVGSIAHPVPVPVTSVTIPINYRNQVPVARILFCCVVETPDFHIKSGDSITLASLNKLVADNPPRGVDPGTNLQTVTMQTSNGRLLEAPYTFGTQALEAPGFVSLTLIIFDPAKNVFVTDILRLDSGVRPPLPAGPYPSSYSPHAPDIRILFASMTFVNGQAILNLKFYANCGDGSHTISAHTFDSTTGADLPLFTGVIGTTISGFQIHTFPLTHPAPNLPQNVSLTLSVGESVTDAVAL